MFCLYQLIIVVLKALNVLALAISFVGTIIASAPKSQGKSSLAETMRLAKIPLPWNPINQDFLCAMYQLFYSSQRSISTTDTGFSELHNAIQSILLPYRTNLLENPFPTDRFYIAKQVYQGGQTINMAYDTVVNAEGQYVDVVVHLEAELYNIVHSQKVRFGLCVVGVGFLLAFIAQILLMLV